VSQEDVDLIRGLIPPSETDVAALLRNDELWGQLVGGLEALVDPEVESVAVWRGGTPHTGVEGFRRMWLDWLEPWAEYHSHVEEVIDAGDSVVVIARDRGRRADVAGEVDIVAASRWEIRNGRLAKVVFYGNRDDALAAAGLEAG
jgi:hypothetical protein